MIPARDTLAVLIAVSLSACDCGGQRVTQAPKCEGTGTISGRVCAPDQHTWVNGASVRMDGVDCIGNPFHAETTSSDDGSFHLENIPPGVNQEVTASTGAFTENLTVTVTAGQDTAIPENQLCVKQKDVKIAVVTGSGDQIETLLDSLNLKYDTYAGDTAAGWDAGAAPFLEDLTAMKKYDLVLVDCGAAKRTGTKIDFGAHAAQVADNLHAYVLGGGSLYASDWAAPFIHASAPASFSWALDPAGPMDNPFDPHRLTGYAPQELTAHVDSPALATFLGKSSLTLVFPKTSGANSLHWGLMTAPTGAEVMVSAPSVQSCADAQCSTPATTPRTNVPLAVHAHLLPAGQRGGNVVYTSFHNVAQSGTDVAQVLKYLVLNL